MSADTIADPGSSPEAFGMAAVTLEHISLPLLHASDPADDDRGSVAANQPQIKSITHCQSLPQGCIR
jgi:hypothetical protein